MNRLLWRAPMAAAAIGSLAYGVWLGLLRLGWVLPLPWPEQLILHGPLMVGGFLGTLVGLERAIGIGRPWAYAAPILSASGAAVLVFGPPGPAGPVLIAAASGVVTLVFVTIAWRHAALSVWTMLAGAAAWLIGNMLWCGGMAIYRVVFWWITFLVLTIAGERLELNRLLRPSARVRTAFVATMAILVAGAAIVSRSPILGVRVVGAGLVATTLWLAANDVARRTVRQQGVTRYIAICMLSAYGWLAVAGAVALISGAFDPGPVHDAILHAVFLGFAITMVFGHAPIVFPAVTGSALRLGPIFYAPYALLQASVAIRLTGDLADVLGRMRGWGGLLNAVAILLFVITVARQRRRRGSPDGATGFRRPPARDCESGSISPDFAGMNGATLPSRTVKPIKVVAGFGLLLAGIVMLAVPGPGWLTIAAGLAMLAADFPWARRALQAVKDVAATCRRRPMRGNAHEHENRQADRPSGDERTSRARPG